jgi:polysaccharide biosynthesis/export protein
MMLTRRNRFTLFYVVCAMILCSGVLSSCVNTRKAVYFPDVKNDTLRNTPEVPESTIQSNDVLGITVTSPDPQATAMFNLTSSVSAPSNPSMQLAGYLVSTEGYIKFPELGEIKVTGLTKAQLEKGITTSLLKRGLLKDPIVTIRHLNFRVTVLGEVARPAVINVPSEKISMLEAIGLAGDITIYGKRDNILLIREEGGQKITRRFNLNSNELFSSEFYYLKSNDVLYVEPNKARVASTGRSQQWVPALLSGLSLAVVVLDRLIK